VAQKAAVRQAGETQQFQQVMVRMPPELHAEVKQRAEDEERSVAQTIRRAVRLYLAAPAS
jgi:predicted HicB family RNase H-like nuclease